jgi:hypothetical protein
MRSRRRRRRPRVSGEVVLSRRWLDVFVRYDVQSGWDAGEIVGK